MSRRQGTSGGMGIGGWLFIAFVVLRLCNVIRWSASGCPNAHRPGVRRRDNCGPDEMSDAKVAYLCTCVIFTVLCLSLTVMGLCGVYH